MASPKDILDGLDGATTYHHVTTRVYYGAGGGGSSPAPDATLQEYQERNKTLHAQLHAREATITQLEKRIAALEAKVAEQADAILFLVSAAAVKK